MSWVNPSQAPRLLYTNLSWNVIVRQLHRRSGDSQGRETFLAPSADKQTRNYDTGCSNHYLSNHHKALGLSRSKKERWSVIYIQIYQEIMIVRPPNFQSGESQG